MQVPDNQQSALDAIEPNGALHPDAVILIERAAKGDLEAQRRIRQSWFDTLAPGRPVLPNADLMAATGLFVARLCAANGDKSDADMLAVLLLNAGIRYHDGGRVALGCNAVAEALSVYERMSAAGDLEAAGTVDKLVPTLPPEVVAQAQTLSKLGREEGYAPTHP